MSGPLPIYVRSRAEQGVLVLTITEPDLWEERLTAAVCQELMTAVDQAGTCQVILDCANVTFLGSPGIGALITFRRYVRDKGGQLVLCNVSPLVAEVLVVTGLAGTTPSAKLPFALAPDLPAAVTHLTGAGPASLPTHPLPKDLEP